MSRKHILSIIDLEPPEISYLIDRAIQIATEQVKQKEPLKGKAVGVYFRKTSTRTRTAFALGAAKLGASVITYGPNDLQINTGETIQDTTRVLAGYLDALVLRTAESVEEMRLMSDQDRMSIINAMSDQEHPTQALADLATLQEQFGCLNGLHMLYLGEGNSTAAALALAIGKMQGMRLTLLTPEGYGLQQEILNQALIYADKYHAQIEQYHDLKHLPEKVDVVYTTRWQTTGSSKADPHWREHFKPFSVTQTIMNRVSRPSGTLFMHDLPAVRDEDVCSAVIDGPQSIVFCQARNKLFSAMAVLEWCLLDL